MGNNYQDKNVSELLFRISIDDKEAFKHIYLLYVSQLMSYIKPFVKNSQEETEEVLQELFLKVWIHRKKVSKANNLRAYLFRMAKHELINRHVRARKYHNILDAEAKLSAGVDIETGLEKLVFKENLHRA